MAAADPTVTVVARWQVLPGRVDEVLALVEGLRQQSLAEPGCVGYEAFRSMVRPDEILLLERYGSSAAIEAHRASAHFQDLVLGQIVPLLASRQVELLQARP